MKLKCPHCFKDILEDEKYYAFFYCRECDQSFDMPPEYMYKEKANTKLVETGRKLVDERTVKAKDAHKCRRMSIEI